MNDMPVPQKFGMGQPVRRFEDVRLLTGKGRYLDDVNLEGQAYGHVLRSPVAHARIKSVDPSAAEAAPGVVLVLTGKDIDGFDANNIPCGAPVDNRDGSPRAQPKRPVLATDRVRHVGEAVAYVVAETVDQAKSAAELIDVDYEMLDAVADPRAATSGKVQLHDDVKNNLVLDWALGDEEAAGAAFEGAAHVTRMELVNNRVAAHPMEPRGAVAAFDSEGKATVYSSTQGGWGLRGNLAENFLKTTPDKVRLVTPDVGGGFGMKLFMYPEYIATVFAAREAGRPVKWIADRAESFLADNAGRDHVTTAEIAFDADHRILGLRVHTIANMGAYLSGFAPFIPTIAAGKVMGGVYDVKALDYRVSAVMTNTCPVDAYRGAGRPESNYVIERLLDAAARELGVEPAEIRRLNMIPADAMPFTTAAGTPYDSGEFVRVMDAAIASADWAGAAARKEASAREGLKRGIGLAYYIEATVGGAENVNVLFGDDGLVTIAVGTQTNGQGHETGYRQLVHERLGIPIENIRVVQGDTDSLPLGGGTGGSRSLLAAGTALHAASDSIVDKGKKLAAGELETAVADIEFGDGEFRVVGTDRAISILDLARATAARDDLPEDLEGGLDTYAETTAETGTFPNGCHIAEVVVDPATGHVDIERYTVVDDIGVLINPMIVRGQVHGGVAQGIGQALHELHAYDDMGQLITGSLQDYDLPKADDVPNYSSDFIEVPCATNMMGIKGAGEAGAVGAPAAVINAVVDALADDGVTHIDMPATPEKVWRALNGQH